jgi:5'-nucleotidase
MTAKLKLLLTNDDGVEAPGIAALREACNGVGETVIVAPDQHLSGCSHTATTHRGLQLTELDKGRFALSGSPVDCTRVGLFRVAPQTQWVLSGVNEGGNLGADVYLSGTVAAAREACLLGKPAIAISQYMKRRPADWGRASRWTRHVLQLLLARPPEPGTFWNVNLPDPEPGISDVPECVFCDIDPHPLPVDYELRDGLLHYRSRYQDRQQLAGRDVALCFAGRITISRVKLSAIAPGSGEFAVESSE